MDQSRLTKTNVAIQDLRQRIQKGYYSVGSRLPGERDLAAELEVSRQTIRPVLQRLQVEGLVDIVPNSGAYVRGALHRMEIGPFYPLHSPSLSEPCDDARAESLMYSFECPSIQQADSKRAQGLGVEIGTELVRQAVLVLRDQRPVRFMEWLVPQTMLLQDTGLLQWMCGQDEYLGHWLVGAPFRSDPSAFERFECRLPTPDEAYQLSISRSQPVVEIERWVWLGPHSLGCILASWPTRRSTPLPTPTTRHSGPT